MEEERQKYRMGKGEGEPCDYVSPLAVHWKSLEAVLHCSNEHISCYTVAK